MAGFFNLKIFLKRFLAAAAAIALVLLVWRYMPRGDGATAKLPGTLTESALYADSEGEFSVEFPAPYFLANLPASGGLPARQQGSFQAGNGVILTAVSLPLPPQMSFDYAADSETIFKGRVESCVDPAEGPAVCSGALEPVPNQEGVFALRRLFFGKKALLMLTATGKGLKAGDPDLERLATTLKTSWSALQSEGASGAFRVAPRAHGVGVVFPGKPELSATMNAGWKTAVYRYTSPEGSLYTATFMSRGGAPLSPAELKRGWDSQLKDKTVAEQACRGGAFAIDCSAELLNDSGSAVRLRYAGGGNGVTVLAGAPCPQETCAKSVNDFLRSAYRQ